MDIIRKAFEEKTVRHFIFASVIYVFISIIVTFITASFLNLMLGWNIILASMPVAFSFIFYHLNKMEKEGTLHKLLLLFIFLLWLAFFPNSFYVITDFIHLGGEVFYTRLHIYSERIYTENLMGYLTLVHIFLGAFIAVFMASYSLKIMHHYFIEKYTKAIGYVSIVVIILLSSIGIYIGRFLRLQSWDVFRPFTVIKEFLASINRFSIEYIFIFMLIQLALYFFITPFLKVPTEKL